MAVDLLGQPYVPLRIGSGSEILAGLFLALCFQEHYSSLGGNGRVPWPALGFLWVYHFLRGLLVWLAPWFLITGELQDG